MGICHPNQDLAGTFSFLRANDIRPAVICSPDETTRSYSLSSLKSILFTWSIKLFVVPDIADTTTTMLLFLSYSDLTIFAADSINFVVATEVPPNFKTSVDIFYIVTK